MVRCRSGKREVKTAPLPRDPRTFDPDAPAHSFHQLLTDVEAQACSPDGTGQVPFQPDKFPKKQGNVLRGDTRTGVLHTDAYLRCATRVPGERIVSCGYNPYCGKGRSIFESVG